MAVNLYTAILTTRAFRTRTGPKTFAVQPAAGEGDPADRQMVYETFPREDPVLGRRVTGV